MEKLKFIIIIMISITLIGFASMSYAVSQVLDAEWYGFNTSKRQGMILQAEGSLICPDGTIAQGIAAFPTNYFIAIKEKTNLMDSTNISLFINEDPNKYDYYNLHVTNVQIDSEKFFINFVGATSTGRIPLCNFTDQGLTNFVMYGKCDGSEFFLEGGNGIYMNATSFDVACG